MIQLSEEFPMGSITLISVDLGKHKHFCNSCNSTWEHDESTCNGDYYKKCEYCGLTNFRFTRGESL